MTPSPSSKTMEMYFSILEQTNRLALATAADGMPNVRVVNFAYETRRPDVLYFTSNRSNGKVEEFTRNRHIAFTTIPDEGNAHVRSRAMVRASERTIDEVKDLFLTRVPGYDEALDAIGDALGLYELVMDEALVVYGIGGSGTLRFGELRQA